MMCRSLLRSNSYRLISHHFAVPVVIVSLGLQNRMQTLNDTVRPSSEKILLSFHLKDFAKPEHGVALTVYRTRTAVPDHVFLVISGCWQPSARDALCTYYEFAGWSFLYFGLILLCVVLAPAWLCDCYQSHELLDNLGNFFLGKCCVYYGVQMSLHPCTRYLTARFSLFNDLGGHMRPSCNYSSSYTVLLVGTANRL